MNTSRKKLLTGIAAIGVMLVFAIPSFGQTSSLLGPVDARQGLTLDRASWTYQKVNEPHPIGLYDQVTVLVDSKATNVNYGMMDRKKDAYGSLSLSNWILLKGLSVVPDPQTAGEPKVRGDVNNKMRSQADLETHETMQFKIACKVVDIRPNGILVIEGINHLQNNDEISDYSLTGEIRAEDIKPDNTVMSANIANLRIHKLDQGHTYDGYRRGWLLKLMDKYQPF